MNRRHVFTCVASIVAGIAALPLASGIAGAMNHPQTGVRAMRANDGLAARITVPSSRLADRRLRAATFNGPHPFGSTPATIIAIRDNGCKFFVSTVPVDLSAVKKDDPRLQPCTPTANDFQVQWSSLPTAAQDRALAQALGELSQDHPTITLGAADPIIRATIQNAH